MEEKGRVREQGESAVSTVCRLESMTQLLVAFTAEVMAHTEPPSLYAGEPPGSAVGLNAYCGKCFP